MNDVLEISSLYLWSNEETSTIGQGYISYYLFFPEEKGKVTVGLPK